MIARRSSRSIASPGHSTLPSIIITTFRARVNLGVNKRHSAFSVGEVKQSNELTILLVQVSPLRRCLASHVRKKAGWRKSSGQWAISISCCRSIPTTILELAITNSEHHISRFEFDISYLARYTGSQIKSLSEPK